MAFGTPVQRRWSSFNWTLFMDTYESLRRIFYSPIAVISVMFEKQVNSIYIIEWTYFGSALSAINTLRGAGSTSIHAMWSWRHIAEPTVLYDEAMYIVCTCNLLLCRRCHIAGSSSTGTFVVRWMI